MKRDKLVVGTEYAANIQDRDNGSCMIIPRALKVRVLDKDNLYNECGKVVEWGNRIKVEGYVTATTYGRSWSSRYFTYEGETGDWREMFIPPASIKCEWKAFRKEQIKGQNLQRIREKKAKAERAEREKKHKDLEQRVRKWLAEKDGLKITRVSIFGLIDDPVIQVTIDVHAGKLPS